MDILPSLDLSQLDAINGTAQTAIKPLPVPGVSPGCYTQVLTNEEYHGDKSAYSSSQLKKMLRSGAHFKADLDAAEDPDHETEKKGSQEFGTAVHTATLEPHLLSSTVAVWEGGRRAGKVYEEFSKANAGKIILTKDENIAVRNMQDAVWNTRMQNGELLGDVLAKAENEKSIFWTDPKTGLNLKCRFDSRVQDVALFDVKTVGDARQDDFVRNQAIKLGYDLSAAQYMAGEAAFSGELLPFVFIAVEDKAPHAVCLHYVYPTRECEFYMNGLARFNYSKAKLRECLDSGIWPSYGTQHYRLDALPPYLKFISPDGRDWSSE